MPVMDAIALALAAERACGLDALIHDVLTKPFTLAELRQAVSGTLAAVRPAGGLLKAL